MEKVLDLNKAIQRYIKDDAAHKQIYKKHAEDFAAAAEEAAAADEALAPVAVDEAVVDEAAVAEEDFVAVKLTPAEKAAEFIRDEQSYWINEQYSGEELDNYIKSLQDLYQYKESYGWAIKSKEKELLNLNACKAWCNLQQILATKSIEIKADKTQHLDTVRLKLGTGVLSGKTMQLLLIGKEDNPQKNFFSFENFRIFSDPSQYLSKLEEMLIMLQAEIELHQSAPAAAAPVVAEAAVEAVVAVDEAPAPVAVEAVVAVDEAPAPVAVDTAHVIAEAPEATLARPVEAKPAVVDEAPAPVVAEAAVEAPAPAVEAVVAVDEAPITQTNTILRKDAPVFVPKQKAIDAQMAVVALVAFIAQTPTKATHWATGVKPAAKAPEIAQPASAAAVAPVASQTKTIWNKDAPVFVMHTSAAAASAAPTTDKPLSLLETNVAGHNIQDTAVVNDGVIIDTVILGGSLETTE